MTIPSRRPMYLQPTRLDSGDFRHFLCWNSHIHHLQPLPRPPLYHSCPRSKGFRSKFARNFTRAPEVLDNDYVVSASCTTRHHPYSTPLGPRNKTQQVVGRWNTKEVELKNTHIRVPAVHGQFGVFSGQIGLGHMYKIYSTCWDLHSCEIWEFLEKVEFSICNIWFMKYCWLSIFSIRSVTWIF